MLSKSTDDYREASISRKFRDPYIVDTKRNSEFMDSIAPGGIFNLDFSPDS